MLFVIASIVWFLLLPMPDWLTFFLIVGGALIPFWLWHYIDWRNDYLVVTDQRVFQRERLIGVFDRRDELSVDRVDNISVVVPDWIQRNLLGTGAIKIEAAGIGSYVAFDLMPNPEEVKNEIYRVRNLVRARKRVFQVKHMREAIAKSVEGFNYVEVAQDSAKPQKTAWEKWTDQQQRNIQLQFSSWFGIKKLFSVKAWQNFFKFWSPTDRIVDGGSLIYRRAILLMLREIGIPLCFMLAYLGFVGLFLWGQFQTAWAISPTTYCIPFGFFGLIIFLWFLYKYEDWRNDTYVLKNDVIVDIYRTPFGLRGSSIQQTGYERITNSESRTKGVLGWFDIGDVILKTGADGELVLKGVYSPRRVLQEILKRRDQLDQAKRDKANEEMHREIVDAIRIYDEYNHSHRRRTLYEGEVNIYRDE